MWQKVIDAGCGYEIQRWSSTEIFLLDGTDLYLRTPEPGSVRIPIYYDSRTHKVTFSDVSESIPNLVVRFVKSYVRHTYEDGE